jgi:hypothetical protein
MRGMQPGTAPPRAGQRRPANVKLHAVSISADLSRSGQAHGHAEQIDPEEIPSRERRGRLGVEIARQRPPKRRAGSGIIFPAARAARAGRDFHASPLPRADSADGHRCRGRVERAAAGCGMPRTRK